MCWLGTFHNVMFAGICPVPACPEEHHWLFVPQMRSVWFLLEKSERIILTVQARISNHRRWYCFPRLWLISTVCVCYSHVCQKTPGSGSRVAFTLHFPKYSRSMKAANTGWRMNSQSQGEVVALGSASSLPGQALRGHNPTQGSREFEGQMFSLTCTMKTLNRLDTSGISCCY